MTDWIKKHTQNNVFKKIIIFYSLVTIFSLTILSCLLISITKDNKTKEIMNLNTESMNTTYNILNSKYITSSNILQNIYIHDQYKQSILTFLKMGAPDFYVHSLDYYLKNNISHRKNLLAFFDTSFIQDGDISSMILYSYGNDSLFYYNNNTESLYYNADTKVAKDYKSNLFTHPLDGNIVLQTGLSIDADTPNTFSIVLNIKEPNSQKSIGKLIINYKTNSFNEINHLINSGQIKILTHSNSVLFASNSKYGQPIDSTLFTVKASYDYFDSNMLNKSSYIKSLKYDDLGVIIFGIIPKNSIYRSIHSSIIIILLTTFICIVAIICLSILFTNSYSNRLFKIISAIKQNHNGNLSMRIDIDDKKDELTEIAYNFNLMCDNLNEYINTVYVCQVNQKNAELKYLQAQINPHFLYNTLESIRMRAAIKGALDVSEMIYILSSFFKISLETDTITTIEHEIEHCKLYLQLFQIRYNNKISVKFNLDESILTYSIVKLSLQPIVENFIIHGIDLDSNDNSIIITSYTKNNNIYIKIKDNGLGIEPDVLNKINLSLKNAQKTSSIGISNVHERLKLTYGDSYGLIVNSIKNQGTEVTIHMPAKKKGDFENV